MNVPYITEFSSLLLFFADAYLAWMLFTKKVPMQNPATWFFWVLLDLLVLGSSLLNNQPVWLQLSCTGGATMVLVALILRRERWQLTWREGLSGTAAAIAAYFWMTLGNEAGVIAGVGACLIAGLPLLWDMWCKPQKDIWKFWALFVLASIGALLGSQEIFAHWIFPAFGVVYNSIVMFICRFKKPKTSKGR